eukprot:Clim_evm12s128 gene=Clim_evmTU12s128
MVFFEPVILVGSIAILVGIKTYERRKRRMLRILKEDAQKRAHCIEIIGCTEIDLKELEALDKAYRKKQWKENPNKKDFKRKALKEDPPSIALILQHNSKSLIEGPPTYESLPPAYSEVMKVPEHRVEITV